MTTPPDDVARVVARLTEAQREVLRELSDYPADQGVRGARPMDVQGSQGRYAAVVLKQLCAKRLAKLWNWAGPNERGSCLYWIEPFGLLALKHLKGTQHDQQ